MFTIGEFAQLTEITVKALHHYDEVGVLPPAAVDPGSRYRRYTAAQLRPALLIRALREADVPLSALAGVTDESSALAALDRHRAEQLAQREAQDRAHERTGAVIRALAVQAQVQVRDAPQQPYLGAVLRLTESDDINDEAANHEFVALSALALELGAQPTGAFWTTLRSADGASVEMVLCLALREPVTGPPDRPQVEAGVLPHRREIVTAWLGDQSGLVEGVLHPAVLSNFEELERRDPSTRMDNVRQVVLPDGGVEVVTTLEVLNAG
jgi:DNA-binding transcriptional MerR regulator